MFEAIIALVTLTGMEIVLGIDNIIFIAIVAGKLPPGQQKAARTVGLTVALVTRVLLLLSLNFILGLREPVVTLPFAGVLTEESRALSWRDVILVVGGLFLIAKSTFEIHEKLEYHGPQTGPNTKPGANFGAVVVQIVLLDLVFSLDSIFTAIGMVTKNPVIPGYGEVPATWIMIAAIMISIGVMMAFAGTVSEFVARRPTLKILALSFLILIGVLLVAEGFDQHLSKGYVYFAMAFSLIVEMINLRVRSNEQIRLHNDQIPPDAINPT